MQVGDTEIVGGEAAVFVRALQPLQNFDGFELLALCKINIGTQKLDIIANCIWYLAIYTIQRQQSVFHLLLLKMNSRETIGGIVAYDFVHRGFENSLDGAPGTVVHAIAQFEVAK